MEDLSLKHRQAVRAISSGVLGTIISSLLATILPWLWGSSVFNAVTLIRSIFKLSKIREKMRSIGLIVRARDIFRGVLEGLAVKFGSTLLLLGHDDVVSFCHGWGDYLQQFLPRGSALARKSIPTQLEKWDKDFRDNKLIEFTSSIAGSNVDMFQSSLGLDDAKSAAEHGHGWGAGKKQLAEQIFGTGSVVITSDMTTDYLLDDKLYKLMDGVPREAVSFTHHSNYCDHQKTNTAIQAQSCHL